MRKIIQRGAYEFVINLDVDGDTVKVSGYPVGRPELMMYPGVYRNQYRDFYTTPDKELRIIEGSISERAETLIEEALSDFEYYNRSKETRTKYDPVAEFERIV